MPRTPPPVGEAEFSAVDSTDAGEIKQRLTPFVQSLHLYLNEQPYLRDLQEVRRKWIRPREKQAFGNFVTHSREFYTYHHGGRNEAHFNISLRPEYFAVGLGFEFTLNNGGDPTVVGLVFACFENVIRSRRNDFEHFVVSNSLEVEWSDEQGILRTVPTGEVVSWILNLPNMLRWAFIARLLRRNQDRTVLENPSALGNVMQAVISGFQPYWEQTQILARQHR